MSGLIQATKRKDLNKVKELIKGGINLNAIDTYGSTALIYASKRGHTNIIKLLLKNGANPDIQDKFGHTALIEASYGFVYQRKNSPGIIKLLIDSGADLDIQERHGATALMEALIRGNIDIVKLLVESGADPNIHDNEGRKPIDNPQVQEIYSSHVRRKLNQAENRMALAKLAKKLNDDGTILDEGLLIKISKEIPFLSDKQMNVIDKRILAESIRSSYKSPDLDKMVELYREQLKNPKLLPEHRKLIRKKKRTRKIKENIPLGSSDLSSSRSSRNSRSSKKLRSLRSSEELEMAIEMEKELNKSSGSKKKNKRKKKKSKKK